MVSLTEITTLHIEVEEAEVRNAKTDIDATVVMIVQIEVTLIVIVTIHRDENIKEKTRATEMVKIAVKVVEDHVTDQVVVIENITQVAITSKLFV